MQRYTGQQLGPSAETTYTTRSQTTSGRSTSDNFTQQERDSTGYLFALLKGYYPSKFNLIWPTEDEIKHTKRMYAKDIGRFNREQIEQAVKIMISQAQAGERECMEPNILVFLKYAAANSVNRKMYQEFLPAPQETEEQRQKRKELGKQKCKSLLGLFG